MNTIDLQKMLDVSKWLQSETKKKDLCGEYEYCPYCENESELPCALAFTRMNEKKSVAVEKTPAKTAPKAEKVVAPKAVAPKKTAPKAVAPKAEKTVAPKAVAPKKVAVAKTTKAKSTK